MRANLPALLFLALLTTPALGQTCTKVPPPFLPGLFPEEVRGMKVEISTDPTGGCTAMYRPAVADRATRMWAVVAIEANHEDKLGEDGAAIRTRFSGPQYTLADMAGWPVVMRIAPLGDEFVAIKGAVRVTVVVKNGDQGEGSRAWAQAVMGAVLPHVPCG